MICFTDFTLQIYQSNRFIRNSFSNANGYALKRFIKTVYCRSYHFKDWINEDFQIKTKKMKSVKSGTIFSLSSLYLDNHILVCQRELPFYKQWYNKLARDICNSFQSELLTYSCKKWYDLKHPKGIFCVCSRGVNRLFKIGGGKGGSGVSRGADWDSKWRLSIYLCTKCNFIWGQGGQSFCQRGSRPPPPPSLATPLVCSLCRKQIWHYFVDNSLKL